MDRSDITRILDLFHSHILFFNSLSNDEIHRHFVHVIEHIMQVTFEASIENRAFQKDDELFVEIISSLMNLHRLMRMYARQLDQ